MAIINVSFDGIEASMGGSSLPPVGWNKFNIIGTTYEDTWDNHGKQVVVDFEAGSGAKIKHWCTVQIDPAHNDEQWKTKKGLEQLALLCECCGKDVNDIARRGTEILHGMPIDVHIEHADSKKLNDSGVPFKNAKPTNFRKASGGASTPKPSGDSDWGNVGGGETLEQAPDVPF